MADQSRVREHPLSPHLQIWRWQVQMVTSILHRATGVVLYLGSLLMTCALLSLAAGPEEWNNFRALAVSIPGLVILFGWSWALSYHLLNGIRHVLQDAGYGFEIRAFVRSSWISVIGSFVLTVLIWAIVMAERGGV